MSDSMFTCHDCGTTGGAQQPTEEQPWHKCTSCGSGFVSRVSIQDDLNRTAEAFSDMRKRGFDISNASLDEYGRPEVKMKHGAWIGRYSGSNIHISHESAPEKEVDYINLVNYESGKHRPITSREMHSRLEDWASSSGEAYFNQM